MFSLNLLNSVTKNIWHQKLFDSAASGVRDQDAATVPARHM